MNQDSARRCRLAMTHAALGRAPTAYWQPDTLSFYSRMYWLTHNNNRLSPDALAPFATLIQQLKGLAVEEKGPRATVSDLASPTGTQQMQARHAAWHANTLALIATRQQDAEPFYQALENLLPRLHPVGRPTGTRAPSTELVPGHRSLAEL